MDLKEMTYIQLQNEFNELLEHVIPNPIEKRRTFLEIGNFPHFENVISSFYRFYFDKDEEHNFGELFIKSVCQLVNENTNQDIYFDDYNVFTEETTKKNGRIDILIEESNQSKAIIIENKIHNNLQNDLQDYWESVKAPPNNKAGIVLTLESLKVNNPNFFNITHRHLINKVKENLGSFIEKCDDRHLLFLMDFFENLLKLTTNKIDMKDTLKYYFENKTKINDLYKIREQSRKHFLNSIKETSRILDIKMENSNPVDYRCLIISKRPSLRYWIQLNQDSEKEFVVIYLDLYGKTKQYSEKLISSNEVKILAERKEIEIDDYDEEKNGISIASKSYSLTTDKFVNLDEYLAKSIKNDWTEMVKLVERIINKA